MSIRTERVAGEIQQALGHLFQTEFADLFDGLITVTKVKLSADLGSSRVYVSLFGGTRPSQNAMEQIKAETPHLRAALARRVRLKFVPDLHFYLDETQEEVAKVEDIFKQIALERLAAERDAADRDAADRDAAERDAVLPDEEAPLDEQAIPDEKVSPTDAMPPSGPGADTDLPLQSGSIPDSFHPGLPQ